MTEYHAYIFVRQDLSLEQQLIQFGHVACVLGKGLPEGVCPKSLNFVGIGVANEQKLEDAMLLMDRYGIKVHHFVEPDIGNQMTAVASEPVSGELRSVFKRYRSLRLQRP